MISIITITSNNKTGLIKTLGSLDSSSKDKFEVIIIDNLSDDGSEKEIQKYQALLKNIHHIREKDTGIYDAMNKGIDFAKGDYLIFMNAGDRFYSKKVFRDVLKLTEKRYYDFIYGDYIAEYGMVYKKGKAINKIKFGMITSHQAILYNKEIILSKNLKYNLKYKIAADLLFTYEFLDQTHKFKYINEPISFFEKPNISRFTLASLQENHMVRRRHFKTNLITDCFITCSKLLNNLIVKLIRLE